MRLVPFEIIKSCKPCQGFRKSVSEFKVGSSKVTVWSFIKVCRSAEGDKTSVAFLQFNSWSSFSRFTLFRFWPGSYSMNKSMRCGFRTANPLHDILSAFTLTWILFFFLRLHGSGLLLLQRRQTSPLTVFPHGCHGNSMLRKQAAQMTHILINRQKATTA